MELQGVEMGLIRDICKDDARLMDHIQMSILNVRANSALSTEGCIRKK